VQEYTGITVCMQVLEQVFRSVTGATQQEQHACACRGYQVTENTQRNPHDPDRASRL